MIVICEHCKKVATKSPGHVNRAKKIGAKLFCSKKCFSDSRKLEKPAEVRKKEKQEYDAEYRKKNAARRKIQKAEYFQRTYDPIAAREHRKTRMAAHVEYCRQPEYKKWKKDYDKKYLATKKYGDFWESAIILNTLEEAIPELMSKQEIRQQNNTNNKKKKRRRNYENINS